jgi:apolipoprotein N-acyltransferase
MQTTPETTEIGQRQPTPSGTARNRRWVPWSLAIVSGLLQVAIFPLPNWTLLCWVALTPLLIALLHTGLAYHNKPWKAVRNGFALAWVSGIIFYAGSCYWVYHVMFLYGGLAAPVAAGVLVLFCLYVGLVHGMFGLMLSYVASHKAWGTKALVFAPFLWVATELFRARVIAFPWDLLGTALVDNIPLSRIATVTGVYGLSFEIVLMNAALASVLLGPRNRRTLMLAGFILFVGILETGSYFEPPRSVSSGTARIVQQSIQLDQEWNAQTFQQTLAELARLSVMQPGEGMPGDPLPDVVIWPESPAPFYGNDAHYRDALSRIARDARAYMIAGTLGVVRDSDTTQQIYNSAQVVAPDGEWIARYDKVHLVPFGEYVPFKDLFSFAKKLTREVGNFVPGSERLVIPVHSYQLGIFICYESIFPEEIRLFARDGAALLVNISNDGWFGDTGAPHQHLRMARMRAIENNRWVIRSTNTGISASIDPFGRVVKQLGRNARVAVDVPYGVITSTTFYSRHGNWFAWFCAVVACGIIGLRAFSKRSLFRTGAPR